MEERIIHDNLITFYFPFSYRQKELKALTDNLQEKGYSLFQLEQAKAYNLKYEAELTHELEQFFYPFVQEKVLPKTISENALNRFCYAVEVKQSVTELYRVLEGENQDRYNQLLFILTVYTVISGIIGMNLVIEDWENAVDWGNLDYSFFEWVAFITVISGIWLSFALIVGAAIRFAINYIRKRNH